MSTSTPAAHGPADQLPPKLTSRSAQRRAKRKHMTSRTAWSTSSSAF
jgi:hypothetical protein